MTRRAWICVLSALATFPAAAQIGETNNTVLVISSDASNWVLHAGGTVAQMIDGGMDAYVVRIGNDEKDSWDLPPEETALSTKQESEEAARILGVKRVISLGFRSSEFRDVPFTTMRDRLSYYIRLYKPKVLFIPNPYTHQERNHDRYYGGRAAEDAWRAAAFESFFPATKGAGPGPHITPEVYYFASPVDPARREPEASATFAPQPKMVDISGAIEKKISAAQALATINRSMAMRIRQRLQSTGRRIRDINEMNAAAIDGLVEQRVRGLAELGAKGTSYAAAEEFRYAGVEFRIPSAYR